MYVRVHVHVHIVHMHMCLCTCVCVCVCVCVYKETEIISYFETANVSMDHFYPVEAKVECL